MMGNQERLQYALCFVDFAMLPAESWFRIRCESRNGIFQVPLCSIRAKALMSPHS